MKKWMLVIGCAALAVALITGVGAVAAWDDDEEAVVLGDEVDVIAHALTKACATQDCSDVKIPFPEPKVSLDPGGPPVFIRDKRHDEKSSSLEGEGLRDDPAYDGDCWYFEGPDAWGIQCYADTHYYNIAVGMYDTPTDRVVMCYYNDSTDEWELAGWSELGLANQLYVASNSYGQSIQIVRKAQNDPNCPTVDFTSLFDYTIDPDAELWMVGAGGIDWIYGSQWSDSYLKGERVSGRSGDDYIELETGAEYPLGVGGYGDDVIHGTSSIDYIYGDGDTDSWGSDGDDVAFGYANTDYLFGGGGLDILVGGSGRDWLYGNAGNDVLWPDNVGQNLVYVDTCYGGSGSDSCPSCESRPDNDCTP
jgi:hypothetical protein